MSADFSSNCDWEHSGGPDQSNGLQSICEEAWRSSLRTVFFDRLLWNHHAALWLLGLFGYAGDIRRSYLEPAEPCSEVDG